MENEESKLYFFYNLLNVYNYTFEGDYKYSILDNTDSLIEYFDNIFYYLESDIFKSISIKIFDEFNQKENDILLLEYTNEHGIVLKKEDIDLIDLYNEIKELYKDEIIMIHSDVLRKYNVIVYDESLLYSFLSIVLDIIDEYVSVKYKIYIYYNLNEESKNYDKYKKLIIENNILPQNSNGPFLELKGIYLGYGIKEPTQIRGQYFRLLDYIINKNAGKYTFSWIEIQKELVGENDDKNTRTEGTLKNTNLLLKNKLGIANFLGWEKPTLIYVKRRNLIKPI